MSHTYSLSWTDASSPPQLEPALLLPVHVKVYRDPKNVAASATLGSMAAYTGVDAASYECTPSKGSHVTSLLA